MASAGGGTPTVQPLPSRIELRALVRRVARASGGRVQVAVTTAGERSSIAAASSESPRQRIRMWSVSKVPTAIALLEAHGWGKAAGDPLAGVTARAMHSALVRSGDCAQRHLVVALQERLGGADPARAAVQGVVRRGGASAALVFDRAAGAGSGCIAYLEGSGLRNPLGTALQLGTAEWDIRDAARFALALGDGTFRPAVQRRIVRLLRQRKYRSDDPFSRGLDVTTDPRWGAGLALAGLRPAYKSGWGGSSGETPTFVVEQVIHLRLPSGRRYGIAVSFEPPITPVRDDPALTNAPDAFRALLSALRRRLA